MHNLAIIIPAYKRTYFKEALDSIKNQSDKRFQVYIGDDGSPEDLQSLVTEYQTYLNIKYVKFSNNIGSRNLTEHWSRCVDLAKDEDWIWLFSDDDIADTRSVASFYEILEITESCCDVYRFNTNVIDGSGKISSVSPIGPSWESSEEMAYNLMLGLRGNSMPDHIFSRNIFQTKKGFVNTQYAQGADWATSMKFSKENGIYIIPHAILSWRYSGENISSTAWKKKTAIIKGYFEFLIWLLDHYQYLRFTTKSDITYEQIKQASLLNLQNVINYHYKGLNLQIAFLTFILLMKDYKLGLFKTIALIFKILKTGR